MNNFYYIQMFFGRVRSSNWEVIAHLFKILKFLYAKAFILPVIGKIVHFEGCNF